KMFPPMVTIMKDSGIEESSTHQLLHVMEPKQQVCGCILRFLQCDLCEQCHPRVLHIGALGRFMLRAQISGDKCKCGVRTCRLSREEKYCQLTMCVYKCHPEIELLKFYKYFLIDVTPFCVRMNKL
ncbi:hypothetical protein H1C71_013626, partial [Ictidomys tridecemlineatus]